MVHTVDGGDWIEYQVGQQVGASATFTDQLRRPANPTTVTASVLKPDGTVVVATPTNPAVGLWTITYVIDQPGRHWYSFKGAGAVIAEREGHFDVALRRLPP